MNFDDLGTNELFQYVWDADACIGLFREGILTKEELDMLCDDDGELEEIRPMLLVAAQSICLLDGWSYDEYIGYVSLIPNEEDDD